MENLESLKKQSQQELTSVKQELGATIKELEGKLVQANQDLENLKAVEQKLRTQLVENSENANISQSQLEANLTEKIKSLDGQNEQQQVQI